MTRLLDYNQLTGVFIWKVIRYGRCRGIGSTAGSVMKNGYVTISINGKPYYAHQLAWLWVHGELLKHLDHKDTVKTNNAIGNLRPSNKSKNGMNRGLQRNNSSGYKGVCFDKREEQWKSYINRNGKMINLGYHSSAIEAAKSYDTAARIHHGEFARLNFPD